MLQHRMTLTLGSHRFLFWHSSLLCAAFKQHSRKLLSTTMQTSNKKISLSFHFSRGWWMFPLNFFAAQWHTVKHLMIVFRARDHRCRRHKNVSFPFIEPKQKDRRRPLVLVRLEKMQKPQIKQKANSIRTSNKLHDLWEIAQDTTDSPTFGPTWRCYACRVMYSNCLISWD